MRRHESSNSMTSGHSRSHMADASHVSPANKETHIARIPEHNTDLRTHDCTSFHAPACRLVHGCNWDQRARRGPLASFLQRQRCIPQRGTTVSALQGLSAQGVTFPNQRWHGHGRSVRLPSTLTPVLIPPVPGALLTLFGATPHSGGRGGAERLDHDLVTWAAAPHPGAL